MDANTTRIVLRYERYTRAYERAMQETDSFSAVDEVLFDVDDAERTEDPEMRVINLDAARSGIERRTRYGRREHDEDAN